jgi:hypothetical protein
VVPDLALRLDLASPTFLDKEFFTTGGRRRELDLLARVSLAEQSAPLLVHVEVEARARPDMGRRLWRYRTQVQAVHEHEVLSIVVNLQRGQPGVQVLGLTDSPLASLSDFRYVAFGLEGCNPAEYLTRPEPPAWGLAALMRRGSFPRPALKLACLRRIATARLPDERCGLLVNCVETYLELNSGEAEEYAALCTVRENREVRKMATTWAERLEAKGREEGLQKGFEQGIQQGLQDGLKALREVVLSQLEQRFGPLPEEVRERVEAISSLQRLTRLGQQLLTAPALGSLKLR